MEWDRQMGMGERGDDMQQSTTGRNLTRVATTTLTITFSAGPGDALIAHSYAKCGRK